MSAMFDDWAYHSVYEPPSPPRVANDERKRARATSIVRSVAHAAVVPAPELRARAKTIGEMAGPSPVRDMNEISQPSIDTPLTDKEHATRWNREEWLGSLSPSTYDFDAQLWTAQMASYRSARDEAELAGALSSEAKLHAENMTREVDWLIHELRDTREHDLEPLRAVTMRRRGAEEQKKTADAVKNALNSVWDAQDRIERDLRGPAPKAVPKLGKILAEIDGGLAFCAEHPDFLGINEAVLVLRTCAQRALAISGAYVSYELMKVCNRIKAKAQENTGTRQALIYTKFSADVARLKATVALIREHATADSENSASLGLQMYWEDTQQKYFRIRLELIEKDTSAYVEPLSQFTRLNDEFIDAARTALVQFKQLYSAEKQVFESLFGPVTQEFWKWLCDEVSDPLYTVMRQVIVREADIAKLGQLIILVHSEADRDSDGDNDLLTDEGVAGSMINGSLMGDSILGGSMVTRSILGGSVLRGNTIRTSTAYGGASIASHRHPDLVHDGKNGTVNEKVHNDVAVRRTEGSVTSFPSQANASVAAESARTINEDPFDPIYRDAQNRLLFRANLMVDNLARYEPTSKDLLRARYPTVDQTLNLLGQVYQLLNSRVFNELAHRCIRECLASLNTAVANRMVSVAGEDAIKIHLFHIKQLLTLQSQIVDFDLQNMVIQEIDFSGIQRLLSRDTRSKSFRELITLAWDSVPQVVEIMFDAMEELYASLRRSVDRMCAAFVSVVFKPLEDTDKEGSSTRFRDCLNTEFRNLLSAISQYTTDVEVTNFLIDSAQEAVMDRYTEYYRSLSGPELADEGLMDIDTMTSWLSAMIAEICSK